MKNRNTKPRRSTPRPPPKHAEKVRSEDHVQNEAPVVPVRANVIAPDGVHHPSHYNRESGYEVKDFIRAHGLGFELGNAVKYIARAGKKTMAAEVDLEKAVFYLQEELIRANRTRQHRRDRTLVLDRGPVHEARWWALRQDRARLPAPASAFPEPAGGADLDRQRASRPRLVDGGTIERRHSQAEVVT